MNLQTTAGHANTGNANVWPIQGDTLAPAWNATIPFFQTGKPSPMPTPDWMEEADSREAYLAACLEQDIAWQVRINRERRGWTQKALADMTGTQQSAIARIEDPTYGKHSLVTLTKLAKVFDCALLLRFVDFETFAAHTEALHEDHLYIPPHQSHHDPTR